MRDSQEVEREEQERRRKKKEEKEERRKKELKQEGGGTPSKMARLDVKQEPASQDQAKARPSGLQVGPHCFNWYLLT